MDSPDCPNGAVSGRGGILPELRGAEFDAAYLQYIVKEHEEAVDDFADEAKEGHSPQLKAYAAKILPTLQEPLQLTRDLSAKCQ